MQPQDSKKIINPRKLDDTELEVIKKEAKNDFPNNEAFATFLGFKSRAAVEGVYAKGGKGARETIAAMRNYLSIKQPAQA